MAEALPNQAAVIWGALKATSAQAQSDSEKLTAATVHELLSARS